MTGDERVQNGARFAVPSPYLVTPGAGKFFVDTFG